MSKSADVGM